jgi:phosphate uptake regulator
MEYRKIVKSGNTSYVVSLPREWIVKNRIVKGSIVSLENYRENSILLRAGEQKEIRREKSASINLDETTSETLNREIVSCYINGYSAVTLFGKSAKEKADLIRKSVEALIAFEIMEISPKKIVVRDCLSISEMSMESIIRKMDATAREMMKESLMLIDLKEKNSRKEFEECIASVESMDKNMNRLAFLSTKIIREALDNSLLAQKLSLTPLNLLVLSIITSSLENFGDNVKNLARFSRMRAEKDEIYFIKKQLAESLANYENAMNAYFTNDKAKSNSASDVKHMLREKNEEFLKKERSTACVRMVERLQAVESFVGIISRAVIDVM